MADYYEILGVSRDATPEQIKKAYRRLARELHPDVAGNDPASEEKFKDVSRAYDVLGNPDKRRAYDLGGDPSAPGGGFGGGFGFQDIFETFFGAATGTTSQRGPIPRARRGQDALVRLDIELAGARAGLLGTAVIGGQATDVLDTGYWLMQAWQDWFRGVPRQGAAAGW